MILTEWDEEKYIQGVIEDSEKRGEERGEKRGEKRGKELGEKIGREEMTIKHYIEGYFPLKEALKETDMTEDEFEKAVEIYQQKHQ